VKVVPALLLAAFVLAGIMAIVIASSGEVLSLEARTYLGSAISIAIGAVIALIVWWIFHR